MKSAISLLAASVLLTLAGTARAQDTLDFDPSGTAGSHPGNYGAGGSGSFNNSLFYDENTGVDELYATGNNALFEGGAGTVTVDAPTTISTFTSGAVLEVNTSETFNSTPPAMMSSPSNDIIFDQTYNNQEFLDVENSANVVFNAPIDLVVNPANAALYQGYFENDSTGSVTINNFNISGSTPGIGGINFDSDQTTSSYILNGTITDTAVSSVAGSVGDPVTANIGFGGSSTGTATLTSNVQIGSNIGINVNAGTVLLQAGGTQLGTGTVYFGGGTLLTDADNLTITNHLQGYSDNIVGGALATQSTFSGGISTYGSAGINLTQVAGGRSDFTGDMGTAGSGSVIKTGAGVVALDYGNDSTTRPTDVQNGTLLLNNPTNSSDPNYGSGNAINGGTLTVESVTPAAATATMPQFSTAILGGTGSTSAAVVAAGPKSTFSPGDMTAAGVSSIGKLTLSGGLTASSGATFNFDLNGPVTNPYDQINFAGSNVSAGGTLTFNLKDDSDTALSRNTEYDLFTDLGGAPTFAAGTNFVFDVQGGPAGYYVYTSGYDPTDHDFYVEFVPEPSTYAMMLAGLALLGFCLRRRLA